LPQPGRPTTSDHQARRIAGRPRAEDRQENGDSELDVIGTACDWDAPRLDVWINEGPAR
jgi:hypothetical protein